MIELRWIVPEGTSTSAPVLQYREAPKVWIHDPLAYHRASRPWTTVPTVVVSAAEFEEART